MRSFVSHGYATLVIVAALTVGVARAAAIPAPAGDELAFPAPGAGADIVFVDALKQAAPWSSPQKLSLDANGNVTSLAAGQVADTTVFANENYPGGDYTLLYDGRARFAAVGATIVSETPGRAIVRVAPNADAGLHLRLLATDPRDYARNVRLILPGFERSYGTTPFYPAFVRSLAQTNVLRFAAWSQADSYAVSAVWPDRPGVDRFTQTMPGGVAPEYEIALANATGKTPWFALPVGATNRYVREFAGLVHRTLDPRLSAMFQYGGAVWQEGTPGNRWAAMAGPDWYASRSLQVFDLVRAAFGADQSRVIRVVTGPAADAAGAPLDRALMERVVGHTDAFAFAKSADASTNVASVELAAAHGLTPLVATEANSAPSSAWTPRADSGVSAYRAPLEVVSHRRLHRGPVVPAFVRPVDAPPPHGPSLTAMVGQTLPNADFALEGNEDWIRLSGAEIPGHSTRSARLIHADSDALGLEVPAGATDRTLRVYVSENRTRPSLRASLGDGSAAPVTISHESRFGRSEAVYTFQFRAKAATTLHVALSANGAGTVALRAATLHSDAVPAATPSPSDMTTYHNDASRSGWDPNEYALNESTVSGKHFGLLGTVNVQGDVLAQPLYVANYNFGSKGTHNALIVATEHNEVDEFDADDGTLLNSRVFGPAQSSTDIGCGDIAPEVGITSTPVIDRANGTMYFVVSDETTSKRYELLLFAVDLATLAPKRSPVAIVASAKMSNGSTISLSPKFQQVRPGLVLSNGSVYLSVGSHCDNDAGGLTGWILRYNASLQQTASITMGEDTNSSLLNSIWMTGYAPAQDASGNLLLVTGNGEFDAAFGGTDYGESAIRVAPDLSSVLTSFTPSEYKTLDSEDGDFGSGGIIALPQQTGKIPNLAVAMGKESIMYLLNTDALGGLGHPLASYTVAGNGVWGGPAYYNGPGGLFVYYQTDNAGLSDYVLSTDASGNPRLVLASRGTSNSGYGGSIPIVSSWGQTPESGVVWIVQRSSTIRLEAYAARGATRMLFAANAGVWNNKEVNPFVTPTVANGRVYVPASGTITVFGLH